MGRMEEPTGLFRAEAVEERKHAWLGQPTLVQPIPLRVTAAVLFLCTLAIVVFLYAGSYSKRSGLVGSVASSAGVLRVHAPADGRIALSGIGEGDRVSTGQGLFTLDVSSLTSLGRTGKLLENKLRAQKEQIEAQIKLTAAADNMRRTRSAHLLEAQEAMRRALADRIASSDAYIVVLQSEQDRFVKARSEGVVIQQDVDDRRQRLMNELDRHDDLALQLSEWSIKADESRLELEGAGYASATRLSALYQEIARLDAEIAETASQTSVDVSSEIDGTITALETNEGQMVLEHAPVLSILPDIGELEIHLDAPDTAVAHVREGDEVLLRYAAFPHQQYGQYRGTVQSVTQAPLAATPESALQGVDGEPRNRYRVVVVPESDAVELAGERYPLQIGMMVEADVDLESRRLYEWIVGPLVGMANSATGTVEEERKR